MFGGYEHYSYKQYRTEVEVLGKEQQIANDYKVKTEALLTKKVEDDYKSKIDAIRATYGMHNPSSGSMPTFPNTSVSIDDRTSNIVFIEQCAETTQQVVSLQEWINLQIGIMK